MDKKKAKGIAICGWFLISYGIFECSLLLFYKIHKVTFSAFLIIPPLYGLLLLISGIGLLKVRSWARILLVFLSIFILIMAFFKLIYGIFLITVPQFISGIINFIIFIPILIYLTRPKVKYQFR